MCFFSVFCFFLLGWSLFFGRVRGLSASRFDFHDSKLKFSQTSQNKWIYSEKNILYHERLILFSQLLRRMFQKQSCWLISTETTIFTRNTITPSVFMWYKQHTCFPLLPREHLPSSSKRASFISYCQRLAWKRMLMKHEQFLHTSRGHLDVNLTSYHIQ